MDRAVVEDTGIFNVGIQGGVLLRMALKKIMNGFTPVRPYHRIGGLHFQPLLPLSLSKTAVKIIKFVFILRSSNLYLWLP